MKKEPQHAAREAMGWFCMLILGAIMTLGGMVIILPGMVASLAGKPPAGLWRSAVIWLAAPAAGIALAAWLTFGWKRREDTRHRR